MKKLISVILALALIFTLAACSGSGSSGTADGAASGGSTDTTEPSGENGAEASGETIEITLSIMDEEGTEYYNAIMGMVSAIEERTNGGLKFNVFPANQLGDYTAVAEEIIKGSVDMAIMTNASTYDNRVEIAFMPYAFPTYEDLKVGYAKGSFCYNLLDEIYQAQGVKFLGLFCCGLCGIGYTEYPEDYADPNVAKDLTLRVPQHDVFRMLAESLGYKTSAIPWNDIYTSLQTGVVEGYTGMQTYSSLIFFKDVTKYWVDYDYTPEIMGITMNQNLFDSLPAEYQTIIEEEAAVLAENSVDLAERVNTEAIEEWKANGTEMIFLTDEERAAIQEKVIEEVWPQLEDVYGADVINELKASIGK